MTCRQCGRYRITWELDHWWETARERNNGKLQDDEERLLPYLSAHTRQAREQGQIVELKTDNWQSLASAHVNTPVQRKLDLVLEYFCKRTKHLGAHVVADSEDFPLFDAASSAEINYCVHALAEQGYLRQSGASGNYIVTPQGWARLMPVDPGGVPGTCFVAMAFDPLLNDVYEAGIKPAVEACGLNVVRVDKIEHNGVVTDLILGEIRRAQVVVADVSLQRQGVYFEAGFALGLGRVVIWSCREDEMKQVHFDTRQYSHVTWKNTADLRAKLEARIRATVPIPVRH